ncbi:hypothetical protein EW146_g5017 [Bondarzewia mesenterica]|uniref:ABM domain-containing protein n=1 Tax=Bondarzewia mesenterica TaxID=1095465 RepID=A0A4S4LYG9_9AGAM|nr:hypothetical protein EW146_g5017 [Bondarzewia mesenterica]
MSNNQSKLAISAILTPKTSHVQQTHEMLAAGKAIVDAELRTLQWFGMKFNKKDDVPDRSSKLIFWHIKSRQTLEKDGVKLGIRVKISAKPESANEVRNALLRLVDDVHQEEGTPYWYAFSWPGTDTFGILDTSYDEEGRQAHLTGVGAKKLFAAIDGLITTPR